MATPLGIFDPDLVPLAWFSPRMVSTLAWFDEDLVGLPSPPPAAGTETFEVRIFD